MIILLSRGAFFVLLIIDKSLRVLTDEAMEISRRGEQESFLCVQEQSEEGSDICRNHMSWTRGLFYAHFMLVPILGNQ